MVEEWYIYCKQEQAAKPVRQKEVADMLSMISYAEENGEKKGENRLGTLMNILLKNKCYSDAEKASEDEEYREELYKEYKLTCCAR